jgi:hypothetical protein
MLTPVAPKSSSAATKSILIDTLSCPWDTWLMVRRTLPVLLGLLVASVACNGDDDGNLPTLPSADAASTVPADGATPDGASPDGAPHGDAGGDASLGADSSSDGGGGPFADGLAPESSTDGQSDASAGDSGTDSGSDASSPDSTTNAASDSGAGDATGG